MTTTLYAAQRPQNYLEYVSRLRPASLQPQFPAGALGRLAQHCTTAKKRLRHKSFFFAAGRPPRLVARPPGVRHWWRGRPSQQFVGKETFRAPREVFWIDLGLREWVSRALEREPRYTSPARGHVPNPSFLTGKYTRTYSCANHKNAQQPLYLQSWPRVSPPRRTTTFSPSAPSRPRRHG